MLKGRLEREELWEIVRRAKGEADTVLHEDWKRALNDLAYAADVLDAYIGRSAKSLPIGVKEE